MTCRPRPCSIKGCIDTVFCRRYCVLHYFRYRRFGKADVPALKWKPSKRRERLTAGVTRVHEIVTLAD